MATAFNEPKYQIEVSDFLCNACEQEVPCTAAYYSAVFFEAEAFARKNYCVSCWKERDSAARSANEAEGGAVSSEPAAEAAPGVFAFWRTRRPPLPSDQPKRLRFDSMVVLEFFRRLEVTDDEKLAEAEDPIEPTSGESGESEEAGTSQEAESPRETSEDNGGDAQGPPDSESGEGDATPEGESSQEEAPEEAQPVSTEEDSPSRSKLPSPREREELRFVLALLLVRKKILQFHTSQYRNGEEWLQLPERKDPERRHWVRNPNLSDAQLERVKDRIGELLQMRV